MVLRQALAEAFPGHPGGEHGIPELIHWHAAPSRSGAHHAASFLEPSAKLRSQQAAKGAAAHQLPVKAGVPKVNLSPNELKIADLQSQLQKVRADLSQGILQEAPKPSKGAAVPSNTAAPASASSAETTKGASQVQAPAWAIAPADAPAALAAAGAARGKADLGECQSEDGRYTVKVTPDGVRRLYDTQHPGRVQTRIQCDGEVQKGQQGKCEDLSWPCQNMRRPFKGYMEDVADQVKPFCQTPGWRALFVGLGGGYMQTNFSKMCASDGRIDTIENSPGVVPIARNMFGFNSDDPKQHLEFGSGLEVMKHHISARDKYDFIFTDYSSEDSKAFLESAQHLLKPGGRLAVSKVGAYEDGWLGSMKDYFAAATPTESAEGNFTFVTTTKVVPKGMHPSAVVEDALQAGSKTKPAGQAAKAVEPAKVETPQEHAAAAEKWTDEAKRNTYDAGKMKAETAKAEAALNGADVKTTVDSDVPADVKTTVEKEVQAAALPEAPAAALQKKAEEVA